MLHSSILYSSPSNFATTFASALCSHIATGCEVCADMHANNSQLLLKTAAISKFDWCFPTIWIYAENDTVSTPLQAKPGAHFPFIILVTHTHTQKKVCTLLFRVKQIGWNQWSEVPGPRQPPRWELRYGYHYRNIFTK